MNDPFESSGDTREEILGAAFRALCRHGYTELTIQRIGESFEKSPSLIYHHYDGKDELLVDLLEFLLDGFEEGIADGEYDIPPRERLVGYVLAMIDPDAMDDERAPSGRFLRAVVELRAQAAHDPAYRAHFDRSDRVVRRFLERAVVEAAQSEHVAGRDGIGSEIGGHSGDARSDDARSDDSESGTTPEVRSSSVAETIQTIALGGMVRWATTTDRGWVTDTTAGVTRYLDTTLPDVAIGSDAAGTSEDR